MPVLLPKTSICSFYVELVWLVKVVIVYGKGRWSRKLCPLPANACCFMFLVLGGWNGDWGSEGLTCILGSQVVEFYV